MATASIALVGAVVAFSSSRSTPSGGDDDVRLQALEAKVKDLSSEVKALRSEQPTLIGRGAPSPVPSIAPPTAPPTVAPAESSDAAPLAAEDDARLAEIVDAAVARKAEQMQEEMRIKRNKKPAMDVLAKMLELTDAQRTSAERVVVDGQRQVYETLDTPTDDGTNLMDELVEIVARRFAEPGKEHGFGAWFQRIAKEKIPGTDQTYAKRIESVKNGMRETFKREWSAEQYREFQEWGVDPTEIAKVPDSPFDRLGERIKERGRALGANIPDDK